MNTIEQSGISIQPKEAQVPSAAQLTKLRAAMLTKLEEALKPKDFVEENPMTKYFSHTNNDHGQMTVVCLQCFMDLIKTDHFSYTLVPSGHISLYLHQFDKNGTYTVGTSQILPATRAITEQTVMDYNWRKISAYFVQKMTGVITNASLATPEERALFDRTEHKVPKIKWIGRRY